MIESIPNPLQDAGVKRDIEDRVNLLMTKTLRYANIQDSIRLLVKQAAEWGMSRGFSMGWKLSENATVKEMRSYENTWKKTFEMELREKLKKEMEKERLNTNLLSAEAGSGIDIIKKMAHELENGVSVEEVVDKYTLCASPELRQKLINGLTEIVKKGSES